LLKEDDPCSTGNSPVPACSLKNDRYLPAQQNTGTTRDLFMQPGQQLRSGCGDVATQDEEFRIEHVQEAYQRRGQRFESEVQHASRARVALGCRLKNSFRTRNPAGMVKP